MPPLVTVRRTTRSGLFMTSPHLDAFQCNQPFLPWSSSFRLILPPWLAGWNHQPGQTDDLLTPQAAFALTRSDWLRPVSRVRALR